MAEAGADHRGYHHVGQQDAEPALRGALVAEHTRHDIVAHDEADSERQTVPPHGQRTEFEQRRVGVPDYRAQHFSPTIAAVSSAIISSSSVGITATFTFESGPEMTISLPRVLLASASKVMPR